MFFGVTATQFPFQHFPELRFTNRSEPLTTLLDPQESINAYAINYKTVLFRVSGTVELRVI